MCKQFRFLEENKTGRTRHENTRHEKGSLWHEVVTTHGDSLGIKERSAPNSSQKSSSQPFDSYKTALNKHEVFNIYTIHRLHHCSLHHQRAKVQRIWRSSQYQCPDKQSRFHGHSQPDSRHKNKTSIDTFTNALCNWLCTTRK